ncbi:MAG: ATP phosphoribosyltransferase, partial [Alphaproteobacteria bacterium]|nr:ATP phosphoribosyltransferase [Alphaproteobacteria bacterium]
MKKITLAVPKGRILNDLKLFFEKINIIPDPDLYNENTRNLIFATNLQNLEIVKVRSFDVANFVKFGGADFGICGKDVIEEFASGEFFAMLDLNIGKCRLSIAGDLNEDKDFRKKDKIRVATKYVNITQNYFENLGIQAEILKLNGALEIATKLGLCDYIVDLVSTGQTLINNKMVEIEKILAVSSFLIVN